MNLFKRWIGMVMLLIALAPGISAAGEGWWNDGWQYRKKIRIDTTTNGADISENLSDVPILVRLHTGNFNFTNAREDGGDIRFVASDDATLLKHHIEKIDILDEIALVWVKVPRIAGGSDQGFIYMYYGNENAIGGQDAGGTFGVNQAACLHLGELEDPPRDATANNNNAAAFSGGQGLPGVIGNSVSLNGGGNRIDLAGTPSLDFSSGFSLSAWVRINMAQSDAWLFSRQGAAATLVVGIEGTKVYASITAADGTVYSTDKSVDLPVGDWHLITVTAKPGGRLDLYLDGMEMTWVNLPGSLPALDGDLLIGDSSQADRSFFGDIDEVRVYTQPLSADRIRVDYASQGPDGLLLAFGEEVMGGGGGMPVFYLGTILRNITLDGLIVIGLLMILSAISWLVFLGKAGFLFLAGRENRRFLNALDGAENPVDAAIDDDEFKNSNIYRIYRAGCRVITGQSANVKNDDDADGAPQGPPPRVTTKLLKSFRTELEKNYINETKRLNGKLTVLTMAISGGPFLGLLGTVWGVMNTFAAMAEAGEANIMAIAPGVASALSTTVAGLIVAIPALFAYNYLTTRIKDITADLTIFVDEFAVKVENGYGDAA